MSDFTGAFKKVLDTDSASLSFTTQANVEGYRAAFTETAAIKRVKVSDQLAVLVSPIGVGDADDVFDMRIYAEYHVANKTQNNLNPASETNTILLGTLTCTLGTKAGAGTIVGSTYLHCDTVSWSKTAFLTAAETAMNEGTSGTHSPADNTQGFLFLPCLARAANLIFEFDATTGTPTGMNVLVLTREI